MQKLQIVDVKHNGAKSKDDGGSTRFQSSIVLNYCFRTQCEREKKAVLNLEFKF